MFYEYNLNTIEDLNTGSDIATTMGYPLKGKFKKDPSAELSEPVEPITWWIENTTPVELREGVKQGVLGWNKSFEKAKVDPNFTSQGYFFST